MITNKADNIMNESALENYFSQPIQENINNRNLFSRVTDWYFKPKSFERSGKLYELLGIRQFKKFMFNGDYISSLLRKINPDQRLIRNKESARTWEMATRIYEGIHVVGFSIMTPLIISSLAKGNYRGAAIGTAINLVISVYPIMLQRYNRARIYNILDKKEKRELRGLKESKLEE